MQTPIDFGKNFLNNYYYARNMEACLEDLAYDLVWVTPEKTCHFLSAKEIHDFLQEELDAHPGRYYVDIVSIKSSPSVDNVATVAYEVNLVQGEGENALGLHCTMVICKRGQHYEITFLHIAEKKVKPGIAQIRKFTENLPCGIMAFTYNEEKGLKTLFYNDYFWKKLRYKEDKFAAQAERDPFFMVAEEERDSILEQLSQINIDDEDPESRKEIAANLTFFRRDGNRFQYRMVGAPVYKDKSSTAFYCVFQDTTGYSLIQNQMQEQVENAAWILAEIPGGVCVLKEDRSKWSPVHVSAKVPELFGVSAAAFTAGICRDPLYGLEMTSITRDQLMEGHIDASSQESLEESDVDPYLGIYPVLQPDGTNKWIEVYYLEGRKENGVRMRLFYYLDRTESKEKTDRQIESAEKMSRAQQERAKEEIRKAQEKAQTEIEQANERAENEIRDAKEQARNDLELQRSKLSRELERQMAILTQKEEDLEARATEREEQVSKNMDRMRAGHETAMAQQRKNQELMMAGYEQKLAEKADLLTQLEEELAKTKRALKESEEAQEKMRQAAIVKENDHIRSMERLLSLMDQKPGMSGRELGATISALREPESYKPENREAEISEPEKASQTLSDYRVQEQRFDWRGQQEQSESRNQSGQQEQPARREERRDSRFIGAGQIRPAYTGNEVEEEQEQPSQMVQDFVKMAVSEDDVLQEEQFKVEDCLSSVLDFQAPRCREKGIHMSVHMSSSVPKVVIGDKAKLQKALCSILESATEHTPRLGEITVACRADRVVGGKTYLYFTVRDDGSGLAGELMQGMFRVKDRAEDPIRIGLYTARELVSTMGGNVKVRTRHGAGSEFIITVNMRVPQ